MHSVLIHVCSEINLNKYIFIYSNICLFVECPGGQVWNECGSACPSTCERPNPFCFDPCEPKCECPPDTVLQDGECITFDECPGKFLWRFSYQLIYYSNQNAFWHGEIVCGT